MRSGPPLLQKLIDESRRPSAGGRVLIDRAGVTKNMTSRGFLDRVAKYASERQVTLAKILVLGEVLQKVRAFDALAADGNVRVTAAGAYWQAFKGTTGHPACHTSPALLLFNGLLPHVPARMTDAPGRDLLQIRIIETFAHCIAMPESVNRVDQALDEGFGGRALAESMGIVLKGEGSARDAAWNYQQQMADVYRQLLETSPAELRRVLGRLQQTGDESPPGFSWSPEEDEILARLDDPNHQVISAYLEASSRDAPRSLVDAFTALINAHMKAGTE